MNQRTLLMISYITYDSTEGLNRRIQGQLKCLRSQRWKAILLCPRYGFTQSSSETPDNIKQIGCWIRTPNLKIERALSYLIYSFFLFAHLFRYMQLADIIQFEQQPLAGILPFVKRLSKKPIILDDFMFMSKYERGVLWLFTYAFDMIALHSADLVVTASDYSLHYLKKNQFEWVYAPNGITFPESVDLEKKQANAVFVGTLGFKQNIQAVSSILDIAEDIQPHIQKSSIVVIGGPSSQAFAYQRESKARGTIITFKGKVSDEDLHKQLKAAGIGLLPFFKNSPKIGGQRIKALEFLAYGLVVLSGPEGISGIDGIINGENCIVVQNPKEFGEMLLNLFQSWDTYRRVGYAAQKLAMKFDWSSTLEKWIEWLEENSPKS